MMMKLNTDGMQEESLAVVPAVGYRSKLQNIVASFVYVIGLKVNNWFFD